MQLYPQNLTLNFSVNYKHANSDVSNLKKHILLLGLVKHMAIVGQGNLPNINKFYRTVGMFFRFKDYLDYDSLRQNHFSIPQDYAYDPTEMAEFSNVVGKAFADYLVKDIDAAKLTFNYEAAMKKMGLLIDGERPDFLGVRSNQTKIAVEAKGRNRQTISEAKMDEYKEQSLSGEIPVQNSVASVAYNLYKRVLVNYYDPETNVIDASGNLVNDLTKEYYTGVVSYLNEKIFDIKIESLHGRKYYVLRRKRQHSMMGWPCSLICAFQISILLDCDTTKFSTSGKFDFSLKRIQEKNVYIDTDGIGLMLE